MFRFFTVTVLLFSLLSGLGMKTFITVRFYVQQEEIAKSKCENKAKPQLKCNGKCQLAKQLREAEQSTENPAQPVNPGSFSFPEWNLILHSDTQIEFILSLVRNQVFVHPSSLLMSESIPLTPPPPEC